MREFGQTRKQFEDSSPFRSNDIAILKNGDNHVRIITGGIPIRTVFYPCIKVNNEGEEKNYTIPFIVEEDSIFEQMAEVDKKVRRTVLKEKDPKSPLQPSVRYAYLIFDRQDSEPVLKVAHYSKTVHDEIFKIQSRPYKETFLENGLMFMHDIIITKNFNPAQKNAIGRGISYSCRFAPDNKFAGKIPISFLDMDGGALWSTLKSYQPKEGENPVNLLEYMFSEKELTALENPMSLTDAVKAITTEELLEKFNKQLFFNIKAKSNDSYLFPEQTLLAGEFEKLGIELLKNKALPPKPKETATTVKTEVKAPDNEKQPEEEFSFGNTSSEVDDLPF